MSSVISMPCNETWAYFFYLLVFSRLSVHIITAGKKHLEGIMNHRCSTWVAFPRTKLSSSFCHPWLPIKVCLNYGKRDPKLSSFKRNRARIWKSRSASSGLCNTCHRIQANYWLSLRIHVSLLIKLGKSTFIVLISTYITDAIRTPSLLSVCIAAVWLLLLCPYPVYYRVQGYPFGCKSKLFFPPLHIADLMPYQLRQKYSAINRGAPSWLQPRLGL